MPRCLIAIMLAALLAGCAGCAPRAGPLIGSTFGSISDRSRETRQEREVRRDTERLRRGEPLKYHDSPRQLARHRNVLIMERQRARAARCYERPSGSGPLVVHDRATQQRIREFYENSERWNTW